MEHPFTAFPKHLHHSSDPPKVVYNTEDEAKARAAGYTDDYSHKDYPKHVNRKDGTTVTVNTEAEEKAVK